MYCCSFFFSFFSSRNLRVRRPIAAKFCTMLDVAFSFIIPVQNFGGAFLQKILGAKTCKIWPDFGRIQSSPANISRTNEQVR